MKYNTVNFPSEWDRYYTYGIFDYWNPDNRRMFPPLQPASAIVTSCLDSSNVYHDQVYIDRKRDIFKILTEKNGGLVDFPGAAEDNAWGRLVMQSDIQNKPYLYLSFEYRQGGYTVFWVPDLQEIRRNRVMFYTYLDSNGDFTVPFQLYSVNDIYYKPDWNTPNWFREEDMNFWRYRYMNLACYQTALSEIRQGTIERRWFPYIFPRFSQNSFSIDEDYYGLHDIFQLYDFWADSVLYSHLRECSKALLSWSSPIYRLLGFADSFRLWGSMTAFAIVTDEIVFWEVLYRFYGGNLEQTTRRIIENS